MCHSVREALRARITVAPSAGAMLCMAAGSSADARASREALAAVLAARPALLREQCVDFATAGRPETLSSFFAWLVSYVPLGRPGGNRWPGACKRPPAAAFVVTEQLSTIGNPTTKAITSEATLWQYCCISLLWLPERKRACTARTPTQALIRKKPWPNSSRSRASRGAARSRRNRGPREWATSRKSRSWPRRR